MLEIEFGRLQHPSWSAEGVTAALGAEGGAARVAVRTLQTASPALQIAGAALMCEQVLLSPGTVACRSGMFETPLLAGGLRVDLSLDPEERTGRFEIDSPLFGRVDLALGKSSIVAGIEGMDLERLPEIFPRLADWSPLGQVSGRIEYAFAAAPRLEMRLRLVRGGFASADGLRAAEGMDLAVTAAGHRDAKAWVWGADLVWSAGEAYLDPFYLASGAVLQLAATSKGERIDVKRLAMKLDGVDGAELRGMLDLRTGIVQSGVLEIKGADLSVLGPSFIVPAIAPAQQGQLKLEGMLGAEIGFVDGKLAALELDLDALRLARSDGGAALGPVGGHMIWYRDRAGELGVHIAGGSWQSLDFGPFDVRAKLSARSIELAPVRIPLLDGTVVFESVALERGPRGWQGGGAAAIEPVSMPLLTQALGLPRMAGVLSASIPGLIVRPGEVVLDGALVISVFGGYLQATRLHLLEPFGRVPRLEADVEARAIDLAGLTETFSFGSISGLVDADVLGLELMQWRPQRFDASVRSSPGSYPRRISQRAVQNISALGGPGAALAIQRGVLGFFESFGYRRLALGCRLERSVCTMTGIGGAEGVRSDGSFVLIEGGGLPALNVIGYNRRIDWNEFLDRLQRVIESNAAPVVQ